MALTVNSKAGEPVAGGQVVFSAPVSGAGLAFNEKLVTIGSEGVVTLPVTANGVVGSYMVDVDTTGNSGDELTYDLTNWLTYSEVLLPFMSR